MPTPIQSRLVWCTLALTLSGCSLFMEEVNTTAAASKEQEMAKMDTLGRRFLSLRQVHDGMTRKEVQSVLNPQVIVGYELTDDENHLYRPVTLQNPFRTETVKTDSGDFLVDYYLVGIRQPDGKVADDELVPLVFRGEKLIGTGWLFFNTQFPDRKPQ